MSLRAFQFLLFVLMLSDISALILTGRAFWRYRVHGGATAALVTTIALYVWNESFTEVLILVANALGYTTGYAWAYWIHPVVSRDFLWVYFIARGLRSTGRWVFALTAVGQLKLKT